MLRVFEKIGNSFFRDPTLNAWDAASQSDRLHGVDRALDGDPESPSFDYTGVGEAAGASPWSPCSCCAAAISR